MQRTADDGGIIISCDFCGIDWDPYGTTDQPAMTEGHRGSVLCVNCLRKAMDAIRAGRAWRDAPYTCALCLKEHGVEVPGWSWPSEAGEVVPAGRNVDAVLCYDCVRLAAKTFHKDRDVDFRWNPTEFPPLG
ncbi:MAG: hypothetical protein AAF823_14690 [Planctomycetota bacterium]